MSNVLIIVTNHATLGDTDQANGTYAPEITHFIDVITKAGIGYDIASIRGGNAPIYGEDAADDPINAQVIADSGFQKRMSGTMAIDAVNTETYDAIFYPGGFGLLSDLATDSAVAALAASHYEKGGILSAVCHGPAGLLPIKLSSGETLIQNKSVTGFTREEEVDYGTINDIPFLLEEHLARNAAQYSKVQPWQPHVVVDERVVTGQNPASAHGVGEAVVKLINAKT